MICAVFFGRSGAAAVSELALFGEEAAASSCARALRRAAVLSGKFDGMDGICVRALRQAAVSPAWGFGAVDLRGLSGNFAELDAGRRRSDGYYNGMINNDLRRITWTLGLGRGFGI